MTSPTSSHARRTRERRTWFSYRTACWDRCSRRTAWRETPRYAAPCLTSAAASRLLEAGTTTAACGLSARGFSSGTRRPKSGTPAGVCGNRVLRCFWPIRRLDPRMMFNRAGVTFVLHFLFFVGSLVRHVRCELRTKEYVRKLP